MGNKLGRRKQLVDDKYTRPQGLYQHRDIDNKKLRKLILDSKLAPCYPGDEDCATGDREECPICYLYYPSLNRSRCCAKSICTECFLQMKPPHSSRPTQCPFCKTSNYAVEYRGERTKEEKGKEQIEEQMVIEAKIRKQQRELHEEEEDQGQRKQEMYPVSQMTVPGDVEYMNIPSSSVLAPTYRRAVQADNGFPSNNSHAYSSSRQPPPSMHNINREEDIDSDLEQLMVMEAIWLSIQDHGSNGHANTGVIPPVASSSEEYYGLHTMVPAESSSSTEIVAAAAALREHQNFNLDSEIVSGTSSYTLNALPRMGHLSTGGEQLVGLYAPDNWIDASTDRRKAVQLNDQGWDMELRPLDAGSTLVEAGTSDAGSIVTVDGGATNLQLSDAMNVASEHLIPDSFEEQMMLAMAVSLADARSRANAQGLTWM